MIQSNFKLLRFLQECPEAAAVIEIMMQIGPKPRKELVRLAERELVAHDTGYYDQAVIPPTPDPHQPPVKIIRFESRRQRP